jgi:hypothetical protein
MQTTTTIMFLARFKTLGTQHLRMRFAPFSARLQN